MELELQGDTGALLGRMTKDQRRRLDALDAAYIDLKSSGITVKANVEALADAVVAFYDEISITDVGHENGVI